MGPQSETADGFRNHFTGSLAGCGSNHCYTWLSAVMDALAPSIPDLKTTLDETPDWTGRLTSNLHSSLQLNVSNLRGTIRSQLRGKIDSLIQSDDQMARQTITLMQDIRSFSPQLVWQQDLGGRVIWTTAAYQNFAERGNDASFLGLYTDMQGQAQKQQRVTVAGDRKQWFDVTTVARDSYLIHFANDATSLVRADQARRDFVQTFGKTFADLSIELAIFDKERQLAMFNPALLNMIKLPVTFLSACPTIDTVLDRLRELRMMPEPKDYSTWRDQFTAVEAGATNGTYTENWALPDGQTYRVAGRPHPDGAFAILFEDITAEVSLTRRFRSHIETGQAVLDTLTDAIAVFSGTGTMVVSNKSYSKLWSTQSELFLDHRDIKTEVSVWQENYIALPMWAEMRNFVQRLGGRKP
jgi:PAS domain-containing protein